MWKSLWQRQYNIRWQLKQQVANSYRWVLKNIWLWVGMLLAFIFGTAFGAFAILGDEPQGWFIEGIWPEALGILVTVLVIDRYYRWNEKRDVERREQAERKRQQREFIMRLHFAKTIDEKQELLLLMDQLELLEGSDLTRLDLSGVKLGRPKPGVMLDPGFPVAPHERPGRVNMRSVSLSVTNFSGADLRSVDIQDVSSIHTNFSGANLSDADMRSFYLGYGQFTNAKLRDANLEGAEFNRTGFIDADFTGANLKSATFYRSHLSGVTLPDGTPLTYSNETERSRALSKFTNPDDPQFWQPEWAKDTNLK